LQTAGSSEAVLLADRVAGLWFICFWFPMASLAQCSSFSPAQRVAGVRAAAGTSCRESPVVNYGRVLGVAPNASKREVKAAYRKLALQCHPDVCKGEECEVNFMEVNRAYESLMALPSPSSYECSSHGFAAAAPAMDKDDPWAEFLQSLAKGPHEELRVDYSSYYSNLKYYGSKARRNKNTYPGSSQYYQGNW